ncbi:Protein-tyrosine phosphatase [Ancylostoma duodenale]|uniref:Protein-tyrosine phosphatase n=1 Tax=Ancylostoma duodenale TaxID=51022 RepID=A0A0C2D4T1_9BILA|nr:Protein-tyrosine phosphatase [Ancylostoma duodenale]
MLHWRYGDILDAVKISRDGHRTVVGTEKDGKEEELDRLIYGINEPGNIKRGHYGWGPQPFVEAVQMGGSMESVDENADWELLLPQATEQLTNNGNGAKKGQCAVRYYGVVQPTGIEGLRKECRVVLDYRPKPGTYKKFIACPQFNRYPSDREFILTQGPKSNTIEDFWKMIFQEQCAGVVMLCNFYEDGTQSCEEFWPTDSGSYKYYGKMFVNNKRIDHLDQYDVYTLEVLPDGCSNSILTRLAHCTTWPEKPGSVAVMCSAGVGRTGTFVAIDAVCTRLFKGFEGKAKMPKYHSKVSRFYAELSKV